MLTSALRVMFSLLCLSFMPYSVIYMYLVCIFLHVLHDVLILHVLNHVYMLISYLLNIIINYALVLNM